MEHTHDMITILGHTAGGKTRVSALVAAALHGEVISADSRQVYRDMDIGTGKDYGDYMVDGNRINCHLVDILDAGGEYNVFTFQQDFLEIYNGLKQENILPVLCGGTGLYIESVLRNYRMKQVPPDPALRAELETKSLEELKVILESGSVTLHNTTDVTNRKRAIRAIEIARFHSDKGNTNADIPEIKSLTYGIRYERDERRRRITARLKERLEGGMIEEAERLLNMGITHEKLQYYGLEYKYLSMYLQGILDYEGLFTGLNTAIHQFAKRQMTYFRGMERRGLEIHWLEGSLPDDDKVLQIVNHWRSI